MVSIAGGLGAVALLTAFDSSGRFASFDLWVFVVGSLAARGVQIYLRSR